VRVLVLGGTGLISTAITRDLVSAGVETVIYNRGRTRPHPPHGVRAVRGDRHDHARFRHRFSSESPFDAVIDMVCFSGADAEDLVTSFRGRTDQIILCSTVEVYSRRARAGPPVDESFPRQPLNAYGRGKVAAEEVLRNAERTGAFGVTILRPAYTYGEGGTLISALEGDYPARVRAGRPIIVPGDGMRSWVTCHRDDVARAFVASVGRAAAIGRTYNITGTETMTWDEYHESVARALGVEPPPLVHVPLEVLELAASTVAQRSFIFDSHYSFDTSVAQRDLDFRPGSWADGLQRMLAWLESAGHLEPPTADTLEDVLARTWPATVADFVSVAVGTQT
jgi:nucleoside-diphosphate-sugar epimerase